MHANIFYVYRGREEDKTHVLDLNERKVFVYYKDADRYEPDDDGNVYIVATLL